MAYKEVSRVDIAEVIRRWQRGNSQRHIASGTGLSRETGSQVCGRGPGGWDTPERSSPHGGAGQPVGGDGAFRSAEGRATGRRPAGSLG